MTVLLVKVCVADLAGHDALWGLCRGLVIEVFVENANSVTLL